MRETYNKESRPLNLLDHLGITQWIISACDHGSPANARMHDTMSAITYGIQAGRYDKGGKIFICSQGIQ